MEARILLATPSYADITAETAIAIAQLVKTPQIIHYMGVKSNYIHFGRNTIVLNFQAAIKQFGLTHLMMIDGDIIPQPNIVQLLLDCDSPMAAAPAPILVNDRLSLNAKVKTTDEWITKLDTGHDIFEVERVGTGCVLIRKEVFETIPFPWYDTDCRDELSSDCWFCDKAAHHGYKFKLNPAALCDHLKRVSLLKIARGINESRKK